MATSKHRSTPEVRLKRYLYTSCEEPRYITGNAETHKAYTAEKLKVVPEILNSQNPEVLLNIIEIVHSEKLAPRPESLYFALALAASTTTSETLKHKIFTTLSNIMNTSEDLCMFLKYYTKQKKKFGTAVNKVIGSYYMKKDPAVLADEVARYKGYHSWTHKDLLKLAHFRCESVLTTVVIEYILHGLERAKAVADANSSAQDIVNRLTTIQKMKRCESEELIVQYIAEVGCDDIKQIPSYYHHSQIIWNALIPKISIRDLITYLPRLYKYGLLKANTPFQSKVVECLTKSEMIQSSQIHPVEVFIGLRNFEKGGKPLDPKLQAHLKTIEDQKKDDPNYKKIEQTRDPPKCSNIVSALHKAMQISFQNPQATGRKFMITIDMSDKMQAPCLNNRNLTCLDAAVILTLSLLRVERDVTVAVFNDIKIAIVTLEKNITFNQAMAKLKQAKNGYVLPSSTIQWALSKKKQVDVFIHFLYYHHWFLLLPKELREREKPLDTLNKYRNTMCLPHTKLITFSLSSPHLSIADGSSNVLDICGFTKEVPKVIEAFSKGLFY